MTNPKLFAALENETPAFEIILRHSVKSYVKTGDGGVSFNSGQRTVTCLLIQKGGGPLEVNDVLRLATFCGRTAPFLE